jgi:hypothetical protein
MTQPAKRRALPAIFGVTTRRGCFFAEIFWLERTARSETVDAGPIPP